VHTRSIPQTKPAGRPFAWQDQRARAYNQTLGDRHLFIMRRLAFIFAIGVGMSGPLVAEGDPLGRYLELRVGTFSSEAQARSDQGFMAVTWHIAERPDDGSGLHWLYLEAWMPEAEGPYLQRLTRHHLESDGTIIAQPFRLADPGAMVGAWEEPERLSAIDLDALIEVQGCELEIVRTGSDRFEGQTRGARCANTHRGAAYAVSQSVLTATGATNWDRGFSADGTQVWGPSSGAYRFRRVAEGIEHCDTPVRMLVFGTIHDRQAFGAYGRALMESGLYPRTGGYWTAISPALEVFEGEPPPGRGVVISHFPCIEAARAFWFDEQYQNEIIPLRRDVSEFEVLVLPTVPRPAGAP